MKTKLYYHLTAKSTNAKTGPIPVSTTSSGSCPPDCAFKGNGCYAEHGPLLMHWQAVDRGERGGSLEEFCEQVAALPLNTLWRYAQAGDLPSDNGQVDVPALRQIVKANTGKRGFGYTHYWGEHTYAAVREANEAGFTINLSANNLTEVDQLASTGLPVVVVLPQDGVDCKTEHGHKVKVCPAQRSEGMTCHACRWCAKSDRGFVVGFLAHGTRKKNVDVIARSY
jgi:hypothetical protein